MGSPMFANGLLLMSILLNMTRRDSTIAFSKITYKHDSSLKIVQTNLQPCVVSKIFVKVSKGGDFWAEYDKSTVQVI